MDARRCDRPAGLRRWGVAALLVLAPLLMGASFQTKNFRVDAPTAEAAKKVAESAEVYRKSIALAWLGRELPPWKSQCPIKVTLTDGEAGGITSFGFSGGRVSDQIMKVEGRLDRILASALPHEITHTVFAGFFGGPMPRWADEGASLLSEDRRERDRHDRIVESLLTRRGNFPLVRLFQMEEYPNDLIGFYGQGYSVSRFLIEIGGRPRFLEFVKDGMQKNWDQAAKEHYGLTDCQELDRAWLSWHRVLAQNGTGPRDTPTVVLRAQSGSDVAEE